MFLKHSAFILLFFIQNLSIIRCSDGDRSPFYQKCVRGCLLSDCGKDEISFQTQAAARQDRWARKLKWNCLDECRYDCMWQTVRAFKERGYTIPKFHGKWPFKRLYGIQEPASTFCSLLNLGSNIYLLQMLRTNRRIKGNPPMKREWILFALISIHAWFWSTVFHTRDTPFTEFMDYASALSMICAFLVTAVIRVFHQRPKVSLIVLIFILTYFVTHTQYLYSGAIDYDYNMLVNVLSGLIATIMWLLICFRQWWRGEGPYVWRMVAFSKLSGAALLLELMDFPPILDCWDAHALWHFSTAPLPVLLCWFIFDDVSYLLVKARSRKDKDTNKLI